MRETIQTRLYQHIVTYEHRYAICGVLLLFVTLVLKLLIVFQIFAITVIISFSFFIHAKAIGFSNGYFSNVLFIGLRYFIVSALITLMFVYSPLQSLSPPNIVFLLTLVLWCLGYFVAFMQRKNFSLWICLLFPSLLLTFSLNYLGIMMDIDISFILALSALAASVRLATSNILDGLSLFIAGYLIRTSLFHILQ